MRIVITGGAGFIGSHLCDVLLADGYEVIVIDNLITGQIANIEHVMERKEFRFVEQDVTDYLDVEGPVDAVLHLASPASPNDYLKYPIQTLKVGALGTHRTLGLALAKGAKYLLASTSEVYGDPLVHPQSESYWGNVNPVGPRAVYDEAKRFSEALTMAYHRHRGLETRIARIFNTYGPRMRLDDGRVVPNFLGQALRGEPLTVYGDGSQTRSLCYISDMVEGIRRLLLSQQAQPVNLGNPQEISISDLAELVNKMTGNKAGVVFKPLPEDDPKVRCPDISRAKTTLGWEPAIGLEEGLEMTIAWFRGQLK